MPVTKNALSRYLIYDKCLRNTGRRYRWQDLVEEVNKELKEQGFDGIGKTQFYSDINYMENAEWNAPIVRYKDGSAVVYFRYSDPSFSITNVPLSETEAIQLKSAIMVLSKFQGMPQFEWVNDLIPLLNSKLKLDPTLEPVVSFDSNLDYTGNEWLKPLFNAIVNKRVHEVSYQDFNAAEPYTIVFHPHHVKQYNGRWFVFGLNEKTQNRTWNMALDRIVSLKESSNLYEPSDINWNDHFYDIIGVTRRNAEIAKVKLKFSLKQAPYIVTKPLHPTQRISRDEAGLTVTISVIINPELERLILGFGADVEVIEPLWLRERIHHIQHQAWLLNNIN